MKKSFIGILLVMVVTAGAHADTALTIGTIPPGPGGPCYDDTDVILNPPSAVGTFTLPITAGTGSVTSSVAQVADNLHGRSHLRYDYSVDMSGMPLATNHCIRLLVHFGTPHICSYDVLAFTGPGVPLASAFKAAYGDVTFAFGPGCLQPSQKSITFGMLSDVPPKTNVVTIIDDYTDPAGGLPHEVRINVTAVVPDVPPNWAYAPVPLPNIFFQGDLAGTNQTATNKLPVSGPYDFTIQLVDAASNGLPVGPTVTQTVQVVQGLFNMPLPFEPGALNGGNRWLSIGVRPSGANGTFSLLGNLPITPAPQALYAYSAGVVADISPNQAVTGLNGITGNMTLVPGQGIQMFADGSARTIIISASGQPSDRNIKTDFSTVQPGEILAKLMELPIQHWRFTNEVESVRHLGPTAQDFKKAFDLGASDKTIGTVDESGVALAAIQGLNHKVEELKGELTRRDAENTELRQRLEKLEQSLNAREAERKNEPAPLR
jgi:hypothetical protein